MLRLHAKAHSDEDALAVVDFVLYDLRREAGKGSDAALELLVLPLHLDGPESFRLPNAGERQAPLLRLVGPGLLDNDGVEHDHICAVALKGDDPLADADHIGCHPHAALPVVSQCIQQILRHVEIVRRGGLGFAGEEEWISAYLTNNVVSSSLFL